MNKCKFMLLTNPAQQRENEHYTWFNYTGFTPQQSVLDLILVEETNLASIQHFKVHLNSHAGSDHRVISCCVADIELDRNPMWDVKSPSKVIWTPEKIIEFQDTVADLSATTPLPIRPDPPTKEWVESYSTALTSLLAKAHNLCRPKANTGKKSNIKPDGLNTAIRKKNSLIKEIHTGHKSHIQRKTLWEKVHETSNSIRTKSLKQTSAKATKGWENVKFLFNNNLMKMFWGAVGMLTRKPSIPFPEVLKNGLTFITSKVGILKHITNYFGNIATGTDEEATAFQRQYGQDQNVRISDISDFNMFWRNTKAFAGAETMNETPSRLELLYAISKLKLGTSAGKSGIPPECLAHIPEEFLDGLLELLQAMWTLGFTPYSWQTATTILLFKKDDPLLIKNYRPITLLETLFKIWEKILQIRLRTIIEARFCLSPNQFGCRRKLGADMAIFVTQSLIDETLTSTSTLLIQHVDLSQAYNRVSRVSLWCKLWKLGIRGNLWKAIISTYEHPTEEIKLGSPPWASFSLSEGLRQGSVLSPLLFIIFVDELLKLLENSKKGACFNGVHTPVISYVDDLQLIATTWANLICLCLILLQYCLDFGLVINIGKSVILSNLPLENLELNLSCLPIFSRAALSHKYVGAVVGFVASKSQHIISRLTNARIKLRNMKTNGMNALGLTLSVNLFLVRTVILPTAIFAFDALSLKSSELWIASNFQQELLRSLVPTDPIGVVPRTWQLVELGFLRMEDYTKSAQTRLFWRISKSKGPNTARKILTKFKSCALAQRIAEISIDWNHPNLRMHLLQINSPFTLKTFTRNVLHAKYQSLLPPPIYDLSPWHCASWKGLASALPTLSSKMLFALLVARAELSYGSSDVTEITCPHCSPLKASLSHALLSCTKPAACTYRDDIISIFMSYAGCLLDSWLRLPPAKRIQALLACDTLGNLHLTSELASCTSFFLLVEYHTGS